RRRADDRIRHAQKCGEPLEKRLAELDAERLVELAGPEAPLLVRSRKLDLDVRRDLRPHVLLLEDDVRAAEKDIAEPGLGAGLPSGPGLLVLPHPDSAAGQRDEL